MVTKSCRGQTHTCMQQWLDVQTATMQEEHARLICNTHQAWQARQPRARSQLQNCQLCWQSFHSSVQS